MKTVDEIKSALEFLADKNNAEVYTKFFKTGKGMYGESDMFIGVAVPDQKKIAKAFWNKISLHELIDLLSSNIHEHRLTALFILVNKFEKSKSEEEKKEIARFYFKNRKHINNWDLVDSSAYKILGRQAYETENNEPLLRLAAEENLWSKRIAVVATMYFIRKGYFDLTKNIVLKNLHYPHDLMHKANGWMLREIGKKDEQELIDFLKEHYAEMPRTTLRYAIEKFDETMRKDFLKGKF